MKYSKLFVPLAFLFCASLSSVSAQYATNSFMIKFEESATQAEIDLAMIEMNSTELWVTPLTETRLWQVHKFPFIYQGLTITDINELKDKANQRSEVNETGLNFEIAQVNSVPASVVISANPDPQNNCNGLLSSYSPTGPYPVRVGVFDTGLNYYGNPNSNYYFDLADRDEYDYLDLDPIAQDDHGHGTHVASVISHTINKVSGQNNAAMPEAEYDILRTFDAAGDGYLAEIMYAFEQAVVDGMQVANFSWSFMATPQEAADNPIMSSIIEAGNEHEVLIIASAGNDGLNIDSATDRPYPACYPIPNMLVATSYDCTSDLTSYANYSVEHVDVALPGNKIHGLSHLSNSLEKKSGTSQSASILSGIAAALGTHMNPFEYAPIVCAIMQTAHGPSSISSKVQSGGNVDAILAYDHLVSGGCGSYGGTGSGKTRNVGPVSVFPNPATDLADVNYDSSSQQEVTITLTDRLGRIVQKNKVEVYEGLNVIPLNVSALAPELYILNVVSTDQIKTYKLVKE